MITTHDNILQLVFNHIAFPPKLPGRRDSDEEIESLQRNLVGRLINEVQTLRQKTDNDEARAWSSVDASLRICKVLNDNQFINQETLLSHLENFQSDAPLILNVASQNAGLFIRTSPESHISDLKDVVFEAFETSATSEQVLASTAALQWDFPSTAVALPICEFENPVFQKSFATFIEKASVEVVDEFVPKSRKAGATVSEFRDTINPAIITQFLMTLLEVNGHVPDTPLLRKRIKDDVCWNDAELPWRRSPFWLVLKVCIQRILYLRLGAERGRIQYKLLMVLVMARLLEDCFDQLELEDSNFLKTKICRRFAKLEHELGDSSRTTHETYQGLIARVSNICRKSIDIATNHFKRTWTTFTHEVRRRIPPLPQNAQQADLRLKLRNSSSYLREVLDIEIQRRSSYFQAKTVSVPDPNSATDMSQQFSLLSAQYSSLAEKEMSIKNDPRVTPEIADLCELRCKVLASEINDYINLFQKVHEDDPEQMGIFILSLIELWTRMDKCAVVAYPFLRDFHPWLKPEMLDVLLLTEMSDFERLQKIQFYLLRRCDEAQDSKTIFSDPSPGSVADRYFESASDRAIHRLQQKIEAASLRARNDREEQLHKVNHTFQELTERKAATTCTQKKRVDGTHDDRGCEYCYCIRRRYRLKISVHEDFLPSQPALKRAVVFELGMPQAFDAYRNATWNIIEAICASSKEPSSVQPEKLLPQYSPLDPYNTRRHAPRITLASKTKSCLGTHYRWKRLPAKASRILLPFGMNMEYFDTVRQAWLKDFPRTLSVAHHFALKLPRHLPFSALYASEAFRADGDGPSSYETVASVTQCPSSLTVHEFVASQHLAAGKERRWLSILTELGAANVNFSLLDTTYLFRLLATQAGPGRKDSALRVVHSFFEDPQFCHRLADQIDQHVELIASNWRETNYMETMLILTTQLCALGCREASSRANSLLLKVRQVTRSWVSTLRREMRTAQEGDVSEKAARYCFVSALLCRRTFVLELSQKSELDADAFQCFIEVTSSLQEALVVDMSKFSTATRNMLTRDIKTAVRLQPLLKQAVQSHPTVLGLAIDVVGPFSDGNAHEYSAWAFMDDPYGLWVTSTVSTIEPTLSLVIQYHLLEGHLLINGRPMGKLPEDIRNSAILKELFGNQRLISYPSPMPNMTYMLATPKEGNHIHLGYRNGRLVIQARNATSIFELIPRDVFTQSPSNIDLPGSLVDNCVHWLDLQNGTLHIRKHPRVWHDTICVINTLNKTAYRRNDDAVVDPQSKLFKLIASIFSHFEDFEMLTVVQPRSKPLRVELRRMDLTFYVNRRNLLQCRQLSAEIDPSQDAGTFYGLQSMIILRSIHNRTQRSIITPLGKIRCQRHGMHVHVSIQNDGSHARFGIDNLLGRLSSPVEPRLLYHKALLHALTSCFIPDPLTGRTGTEEALASLQLGVYQPWTPLDESRLRLLDLIANLSPQRKYYPEHKRCQQQVHWHPDLTATIQHDSLRKAVNAILSKSRHLETFHTQGPADEAIKITPVSCLAERAISRRSLFERPGILLVDPSPGKDIRYIRHDTLSFSSRSSNVSEIISLLKHQPNQLKTTKNLKKLLDGQPVIGGYATRLTSNSLEESLSSEVSLQWGGFVRLCRESGHDELYSLMFELGILAFAQAANMELLRTIVAFFLLDDLKEIGYPPYSTFRGFQHNDKPTSESLLSIMFSSCEEHLRNTLVNRKKKIRRHLAATLFSEEEVAKRKQEYLDLARWLMSQWPCEQPSADHFKPMHIDITVALKSIMPEWKRMYQNLQLATHIQDVQQILNMHSRSKNNFAVPSPPKFGDVLGRTSKRNFFIPQLGRDLLQQMGPEISIGTSSNGLDKLMTKKRTQFSRGAPAMKSHLDASNIMELERITEPFLHSTCLVESNYGKDMWKSIEALKTVEMPAVHEVDLDIDYISGIRWLNKLIGEALDVVNHAYTSIVESVVNRYSSFGWLQAGNLWPAMTPVSLLEQLRSTSGHVFGRSMKEALTGYGLSIINAQRLMRIKEAFAKKDKARMQEEYHNPGHLNWNPLSYPDWLLLEIDGNFQIREEQVLVAKEMIHPTSGSNSALQLNMGKGKTSVIIPMIASILADRTFLTRVMVPKALLSQTAQILQSRLGGLLGRDITHVPFSRRSPTTNHTISEYRRLHEEVRSRSGIILAVPEHILSFKLSGLQRVSDFKMTEAVDMVTTQRWLEENCRDILDECDFTLAVKTQLIYPSGAQLAVDGHPERWGVIMTVLDLVVHHLMDLARDSPQSIDIMRQSYTEFPIVYILRETVATNLIQRLVDSICFGQTNILPIVNFTSIQRKALRQFISDENVDSSVCEEISAVSSNNPKLSKIIHLLRGLLAHGLLLLCLKKRWNVQYGLHPNRDPMAVPFHAKGVPSDQAEWGHPDVAILFTILSFYHQGLNVMQLRQGLQAVLSSDDPSTEYARWTQASNTLPEPLQYWNIINVDDEGQVMEIWRHLRLKMVVINHYLSKFVFPAHAKQFNIKLQASGWDIPLSGNLTSPASTGSTRLSNLTTGFSGTNDNRRLLPLTIKQRDLPSLVHTSAEVLTYLLQHRNRGYVQAIHDNGRRYSEIDLLQRLVREGIRILIDAGAFILEMENQALVKEWLEQDGNAQAAVYFGADNKAWVQYKTGKTVPLIATPFVDNMEDCLVYLDEAHTRGTDLKFPPSAVGALTLGHNQTKDHTVQAAMRLRKLGTTQSIVFVSPPEVHRSIMDVRQNPPNQPIDSSDVIHWLLVQTCATNRDLQSLYFAQGMDFCRRTEGASRYREFLTSAEHRDAFVKILQKCEHQTLEELYSPLTRTDYASGFSMENFLENLSGELNSIAREMEDSFRRMTFNPISVQSSSLEEVEQEREVAFEVEEERQMQRPSALQALKFPGLHPDIRKFVKTGVIETSAVVLDASDVLRSPRLGASYDERASTLLSHLYVSPEFLKAVRSEQGINNSDYMRPVNWLLWSEKSKQALVIIPEEAEIIIPRLRRSQDPGVHLIVYAAPVTKKMLQFNSFNYYSLPRLPENWSPPVWLPFEVGILAGRLYFEYSEYNHLLENLQCKPVDNAVSRTRGIPIGYKSGENESLLNFLQEWLAFRRQGQDISHTPMGYICQGLPLRSDHPFWAVKQMAEQHGSANSQFFAQEESSAGDDNEEYYDSEDEGEFFLDNGDLIDPEEDNEEAGESV